jgi:putative restriction endonuclease
LRAYVGVTDKEWYDRLSSQVDLDEVNFWQPSGNTLFRALDPGELFLFKLHSPDDFIVGGGFFAHFSLLPVSLAWDTFEVKNGASSLEEMRVRIEKYRRHRLSDRSEDYTIGCILLEQPFFLSRELWVEAPRDWSRNIVRGKGYDLTVGIGRDLWARVERALQTLRPSLMQWPVPSPMEAASERYGSPAFVLPRLGQGSFRVLVTDAYARRCAVTGERVLPVLEAAHIKPHSKEGPHAVENGLLLRRDLHTLFDKGYVTVSPDLHLEVSRRIREDWENGRDYYRLQGVEIRRPARDAWRPSPEYLAWHNETVFLG